MICNQSCSSSASRIPSSPPNRAIGDGDRAPRPVYVAFAATTAESISTSAPPATEVSATARRAAATPPGPLPCALLGAFISAPSEAAKSMPHGSERTGPAVEPSSSAPSQPRHPSSHLCEDHGDLAWSASSVAPSQPPPPTVSTERVIPALRFRIPEAPQPLRPVSPELRAAPRKNEPCCFVCAAPSHYWLSDYGKRIRYHRSRAP